MKKLISTYLSVKVHITLTLSFLILAFTSCSTDDPVPGWPPSSSLTEQTLIMYMPWSTNLFSAFEQNLSDMKKAINERGLQKERVMVFLSTSPTQATLYEITDRHPSLGNEVYEMVSIKKYESPDLITAQGMSSVFQDIKRYAPAQRYAMTIGCHGMGWLPVGSDPTRTRATARTLPHSLPEVQTRWFGGTTANHQAETTELANALRQAGLHMDFILFDDCYMANLDVAYDLKDVTDFLIASTSEIMLAGMPYARMGKHLLGAPNYKGICDEFHSFYSSYTIQQKLYPYGTISVIQTTELDRLATLLKTAHAQYSFSPTHTQDLQTLDGYNPSIFFDFGDYINKLCPDGELKNQILAQLHRTVVEHRHTASFFTAERGGISIPIQTFSGITTSAPSTHTLAIEAKKETAWYKASHP